MKKEFKLAVVSDVHLGHPKNTTEYIVKNLEKAFPDTAETASLDLIVIAGDLFDRLLNLSDTDVTIIDMFIFYLLRLCKKYDIMLRVLEGTPSHDWTQSKRFTVLNDGVIDCDLKYVKDLSIEYIPKYEINVLYVPDEWSETPDDTLRQVRQLLVDRGLNTVDYAFMHGCFDYQLPIISKDHKHDLNAYLSIVTKLIFIGHVHTFSRRDRAIAQGSFDRLGHNEEEPKGHVRATVKPNGEYKIKFIENKNARKFITIECQDLEINDTLKLINERIENIEDGSFVRISCSSNNPIIHEMGQLILNRPMLHWSKKINDSDTNIIEEDIDPAATDDYVAITITPDNIKELMIDRLSRKCTDETIVNLAVDAIGETINA